MRLMELSKPTVTGGVREPTCAGRFYPASAETLRAAVQSYLEASPPSSPERIEEHAGSPRNHCAACRVRLLGPIAGRAHAVLRPLRGQVERVVLFGPSHFFRVAGLALPSSGAFLTPLGPVPIDREAIESVRSLPQVVINDAAHSREHSLEVHVPFLQEVLGTFKLVPFAVGETDPDAVAEVIDRLWGGPETFFVVSSDLSHFHDHDTAARVDAETSRRICGLKFEELSGEQCCGFKAISGLLKTAKSRGLAVRMLDLRNSGDTAGSRDRVVGYGAYVVECRPEN